MKIYGLWYNKKDEMSDSMKRFTVVAKKDEVSEEIEKHIKDVLTANGWKENKENPALVLCVGGDGTFLFAVHKYLKNTEKVAFLGIHTGTLGFFTDYTKDELDDCLNDILNKEMEINKVPLLQIELEGNKKEIYYAINEMRIENVIRTQDLTVTIDGEFFENYKGTGMCVSTQAGSTAYNRSLKGAVIDKGLNLLQLHEITGIHHSLYHSLGVPFILNSKRKICFTSSDFSSSILCFDHQHCKLDHVNSITVSISKKSVNFAIYRKISYLDRIRNLY